MYINYDADFAIFQRI